MQVFEVPAIGLPPVSDAAQGWTVAAPAARADDDRLDPGTDPLTERPDGLVDAALIAYASGFDSFVVERGPSLVRTAFLLTGDRHAAEDVVQLALAKVAPRFDAVAASSAYRRSPATQTGARSLCVLRCPGLHRPIHESDGHAQSQGQGERG